MRQAAGAERERDELRERRAQRVKATVYVQKCVDTQTFNSHNDSEDNYDYFRFWIQSRHNIFEPDCRNLLGEVQHERQFPDSSPKRCWITLTSGFREGRSQVFNAVSLWAPALCTKETGSGRTQTADTKLEAHLCPQHKSMWTG